MTRVLPHPPMPVAGREFLLIVALLSASVLTTETGSAGALFSSGEPVTIPLDPPARMIAGLPGGRLALGEEGRVATFDIETRSVWQSFLVDGVVTSLSVASDAEGRPVLGLSSRNADTGASTIWRLDSRNGGPSFAPAAKLQTFATREYAKVVVAAGGHSIVVFDPGETKLPARIYTGFVALPMPDPRPVIAVLPLDRPARSVAADGATGAARRAVVFFQGDAAFLNFETYSLFRPETPTPVAAVPPLTVFAPTRSADPFASAAMLDSKGMLTIFGVSDETVPAISLLSSIATIAKDAKPRGRPIVVADGAFRFILTGFSGDAALEVYRTVGAGVERVGSMDLGMPIQDATVLPTAGPKNSDVFVFLSDGGKQLLVVPDPTRLGAPALDAGTAGIFSAETTSDDSSAGAPAVDEAVLRQVQSALGTLGYRIGVIDGIAGPMTRSAVRAFQFSNNLEVTGDVDRKTLEKLAAATTKAIGPRVDLAPPPESGVDPKPFTIYVQFAGATREDVESLVADLRRGGWAIPGPAERLGSAAGLREVRYGRVADKSAAEALADALTRSQFTAQPVKAKFVRAVRPEILEVWISR